jgi:hypothetical protein
VCEAGRRGSRVAGAGFEATEARPGGGYMGCVKSSPAIMICESLREGSVLLTKDDLNFITTMDILGCHSILTATLIALSLFFSFLNRTQMHFCRVDAMDACRTLFSIFHIVEGGENGYGFYRTDIDGFAMRRIHL